MTFETRLVVEELGAVAEEPPAGVEELAALVLEPADEADAVELLAALEALPCPERAPARAERPPAPLDPEDTLDGPLEVTGEDVAAGGCGWGCVAAGSVTGGAVAVDAVEVEAAPGSVEAVCGQGETPALNCTAVAHCEADGPALLQVLATATDVEMVQPVAPSGVMNGAAAPPQPAAAAAGLMLKEQPGCN